MAQDSSRPDFWDQRYRGGVMPWDAGAVPAKLFSWIREKKAPLRILVPGCGSGYEVKLFAELGHDVLAIDFSDAALEAARQALGPLSNFVRKADFFSFEENDFDVIYERALLCALPRRLWPQWAARMGELVRPGGELAGFFYIDDNERGPPFGIALPELNGLLEKEFSLLDDRPIPAAQSIAVWQGKERWQVWKRRI